MPRPLRAQLLELAIAALEAIEGRLCADVEITLRCGKDTITLVARPEELTRARKSPPGVGPLEAALLRVATRAPQTAKRLAGKLRRPCNSHLRDQLRSLVRKGLLLHGPDGYSLPGK
jgi:hypothetical protein